MAPNINIKPQLKNENPLFRIYSVPIRISSPELHVSDTSFLHRLLLWGDT